MATDKIIKIFFPKVSNKNKIFKNKNIFTYFCFKYVLQFFTENYTFTKKFMTHFVVQKASPWKIHKKTCEDAKSGAKVELGDLSNTTAAKDAAMKKGYPKAVFCKCCK
jgi:hypothetical protein